MSTVILSASMRAFLLARDAFTRHVDFSLQKRASARFARNVFPHPEQVRKLNCDMPLPYPPFQAT